MKIPKPNNMKKEKLVDVSISRVEWDEFWKEVDPPNVPGYTDV